MYAGASGDFNVIHWNERVARSVGLPDVIAHGMLTMAEAVRVVTDWVGDPGAVVQYGVRFTRPVVVPDETRRRRRGQRAGDREARRRHVRVELTAAVRRTTRCSARRVPWSGSPEPHSR